MKNYFQLDNVDLMARKEQDMLRWKEVTTF